jgi:hypothetical protein
MRRNIKRIWQQSNKKKEVNDTIQGRKENKEKIFRG